MIEQVLLDIASRACLDAGVRLLQGFRLAATDRAHVACLLERMDPAFGTSWLDIGAGFGEVADIMSGARPDLDFTLLNNNAFQNAFAARYGFPILSADMHAIPAGDETYDGCMMLYALCHADDFENALLEAARVTKIGGKLFVYDYIRRSGNNALMRKHLAASALTPDEFEAVVNRAGWRIDDGFIPEGDDSLFRKIMNNDALYDSIFEHLSPVVWRATREH